MKTQTTEKLVKTIVFILGVEKQGSRDDPGTPGHWPPETNCHLKTYTQIDFVFEKLTHKKLF